MSSLTNDCASSATYISAMHMPYLCTDVCWEEHVKVVASQLSVQHLLLPAHDEQGSCLNSVREQETLR